MKYLSADDLALIHDNVIHPHELQGKAIDKSVEGIIARIETRLTYGLIHDIFELAACYAVFIVVVYAFNDANKRTAFAAMDMILVLNNIELVYPNATESGDKIRDIVMGKIDENDLAHWLKSLETR